jgi:hypothetical protein
MRLTQKAITAELHRLGHEARLESQAAHPRNLHGFVELRGWSLGGSAEGAR